MIGIEISQERNQARIGIGDMVQFTSIPENYFRHTGKKLIDLSKPWVFDHNPYVLRDVPPENLHSKVNIWDAFVHNVPKQLNGREVLLSQAEAWSRHFGNYPVVLNRPRLYAFEEFPFNLRRTILLHTHGVSHGKLPEHVVKHVLDKYKMEDVTLIGKRDSWDYSFRPPPYIETNNIWDLSSIISRAKMLIGIDSGPSWIAACYPDIIVKKVRMFPAVSELKSWVPLEWCRLGSYWDDRCMQIYNPSEDDVGFTWSYKRI